jgi:hypothetical protein
LHYALPVNRSCASPVLLAIELAIERAEHVHARVGYPEGPQVPNPRVAEWEQALQKHLYWWIK